MVRLIFASLLFCVIGVTACNHDSKDQSLPIYNAATLHQLDSLQAEFNGGDLENSMARARNLHASIQNGFRKANSNQKTILYQHLAMLHFYHWRYKDSIKYYAERASLEIPENAPTLMVARQLLCESFRSFVEFADIEVQVFARRGQDVLKEVEDQKSPLYGHLVMMEARGIKQQAYDIQAGNDPFSLFDRSRILLQNVVSIFEAVNSPWKLYAMEHLGVLHSKYPKFDPQFPAYAASVAEAKAGQPYPFGFQERLLAYWHRHRNRGDSSTFYYQKLLESDGTEFMYEYASEGYYILMLEARESGRFDEALMHMTEGLVQAGCCPASDADMVDCTSRASCVYIINELATIYQRRFESAGKIDDRLNAFKYNQLSLATYEDALRSGWEEGVLDESSLLGQRIINAALRTSKDMIEEDYSEENFDALLRAMETGKSLLFTKELLRRQTASIEEHLNKREQHLEVIEEKIRLMKSKFVRDGKLSEKELSNLVDLIKNRNRIRSTQEKDRVEVAKITAPPKGIFTIAEVRRSLQPAQVLIEFAETEESIFSLYVDRDTFITQKTYRNDIGDYVSVIQNALSGESHLSPFEYAEVGHKLYKQLFGSFINKLNESQKELLLVTSSTLNNLPFAALVAEKGDSLATYADLSFLIESHTMRYLNSWNAHNQLESGSVEIKKKSNLKVGVWTNPSLDNYLGNLVNQSILGPSYNIEHFEGNQCNTNSLISESLEFDIIHLSVHARGNPAQLNDNYIYLNRDDSINGVRIGRLPLNAELVVLAACSTAKGFASGPEGTYSLRRSFQVAGVPNVVSSTYDLPAAATGKLLSIFYKRLATGDSVVNALAIAQRSSLNGQLGKRYIDPRYWAGLAVG